jgi:hypothetical protein
VVGMPTWLWVEGLPPVMEVKTTPPGEPTTTVRVWAAMDKVTWTTTDGTGAGTTGPTFTCGGGPAGQGYGIPYDDHGVYRPDGDDAPNACVNTFSAPYYAGDVNARTAGVYTLTGSVDYHIEYTEADTNGKITKQGPVPGYILVNVKTKPTRIRVGEIQALATTP